MVAERAMNRQEQADSDDDPTYKRSIVK